MKSYSAKANRILLTLFLLFSATSLFAADKPNILVIWGDDIGWSNVSAYNLGMMGYNDLSPSADTRPVRG